MSEDDLMVFEESSTGKWLVVERTDDQYEFNSYLFDKNKSLINKRIISTLFDKSVSVTEDGLPKACDGAMELYGINKTDVFIAETEDIQPELDEIKRNSNNSENYKEHIKQDFLYISKILEYGDSLIVRNKSVGPIYIDKGNIGKSGNGLQHIIEQRFEKDKKSVDEITAVLALVLDSTEDGKIVRNTEIFQDKKDIGTFDLEKKGIISFVSKTRDGNDEKFVITGFDDFSKKEEAGAAIKAVIAENSYAPEFVIVKEQVVATIASSFILHLDEIKNNLEKNNLKKAKQETEKLKPYETSEELKKYFSDKTNKKKVIEATESINAVIAQYGQSSEFLDIYAQVGAVIASCNILPQSQENSNTKESSINSKFNQLAKEYNGLLKEFDENIKDYNELLSAYNKSQEENKKLKNQINSQNNNSIQR